MIEINKWTREIQDRLDIFIHRSTTFRTVKCEHLLEEAEVKFIMYLRKMRVRYSNIKRDSS